jgi:predicted  nucleic acid-binding Zn-ribbon protein
LYPRDCPHRHKVKKAQAKLKDARVKAADYEKKCALLEKDEDDSISTAQKICEREEEIEPSTSTASLHKRRQQITIRLEKEAKKAGGRTLDAIEDDLHKAKRALANANASMVHVKKTQQMVKNGFKSRAKKYRSFRRTTALTARKQFNRKLGKKGELSIIRWLPFNVSCPELIGTHTSFCGGKSPHCNLRRPVQET